MKHVSLACDENEWRAGGRYRHLAVIRASDWAVSPHRAAAEAAAMQAAKEQARHDLDVLYDALAVLQRRNKAYRAAGLKAETAVTMRQIENTEAQINERRAVLEGKATR